MLKSLLILVAACCGLFTNLIAQPGDTSSQIYQDRMDRTEWFRNARFGMFIHWGIYAIPARGEWVRSQERLTVEDYQPYFEQFDPYLYNPKEWAKLAKEAGMKYAVLTAKHHDGFCLWDTKTTDYKATKTPAGRDLLREYADAFRAEGLKVGFYYSLIDWYHPDYPAYGDRQHPMRDNPEFKNKKHNFDRYLDYMHEQVTELVTNYGKIDIMWFDFSYNDYTGEKWRATELVNMVRKHQPEVIIDNRLGGHMEAVRPEAYAGDFEGPEQIIPYEGVFDEEGRRIPWESCITLNNNWGYKASREDYKTATDIVRTLVNCVSKGGNLLLNVGPDAKGKIPKESVDVLKKVGAWMKQNQESIYNCEAANLPKPEWGRYTRNGNKLYAHVFDTNIGQLYLKGLKGKIKSAKLLRDGSEVFIADFWLGERSYIKDDDVFMNFGKPLQWTYPLPDKVNTVVEIELK